MRCIGLLLVIGLLMGSAHALPLSAGEQADGFVSLFNGKDLQGWHVQGNEGAWAVQEAVIRTEGLNGNWLVTDSAYGDFVLRLEYRIGDDGNSGIGIRAANGANPAYGGVEVQVLGDCDRGPAITHSGSIYGAAAATKNTSKPPWQWNAVEIRVEGPRVQVKWNGEDVLDARLDDPEVASKLAGVQQGHPETKLRGPVGHIGLQDHGYPVEYRNIRIKPLIAKPKPLPNYLSPKLGKAAKQGRPPAFAERGLLPTYVTTNLRENALADGPFPLNGDVGLTGWTMVGDPGGWACEDGVITVVAPADWLRSNDQFENFLLHIEYACEQNSGIFLRATEEGNPAFTGMELQVYADHGAEPTAHSAMALYGSKAPDRNMSRPAGEWNDVDITCIGRELRVVWNGEHVHTIDLGDPDLPYQEKPVHERVRRGYIGVQNYGGQPVWFRDVWIKALP